MPDLPVPAEDLIERMWCADLAAQCRLMLNHLASALAHAKARNAPTADLEARMRIGIEYEFRLARRGGSKSEARYEPSALGEAA